MSQLPHDIFLIKFCLIGEGQVPLYGFQGLGLQYDQVVPTMIAERLQLSYYPEGDAPTEMCFLNSPELRSEFKVSFTQIDLGDYLNALLHSKDCLEHLKDRLRNESVVVPFPADQDVFWRSVEAGQVLRHTFVR